MSELIFLFLISLLEQVTSFVFRRPYVKDNLHTCGYQNEFSFHSLKLQNICYFFVLNNQEIWLQVFY